ncbi:hypothetical protein ACFL7M_10325 [Thermodesulfobacteriota bacterium]
MKPDLLGKPVEDPGLSGVRLNRLSREKACSGNANLLRPVPGTQSHPSGGFPVSQDHICLLSCL